MLLAILAASITYQAGISPPGGFWSDNNGHQAGDPVFHDEFPTATGFSSTSMQQLSWHPWL
jgi:hypothetical protein